MQQSTAALVDLARVDPTRALEDATRLLDDTIEPLERVLLWRAIGMARRVKGDAAGSADAFRRSATEAAAARLEDEAATSAISLAGSLGLAGNVGEALEVLDGIDPTPETIGRIHFQRASMLIRAGRITEAHAEFDRAIPHLEANRDMQALGLTHNNLGLAALLDGEAASARRHFEQALEAFTELGDRLQVAATGHNLGQACAAAGELVDALDWFNRTLPTIEDIAGPSFEPGRCNALLAAGLFEEAHTEALRLAARLDEVGMASEIPETWLLAAEASILMGDRSGAGEEAARAASLFAAQDRHSWEAMARLLELEAKEGFGDEVATSFDDLIATLDATGMSVAAGRARASVARSLARAGRVEGARRMLIQARSSVSSAPLALEVDLRLTTVEVLRAAGRTAEAARTAADGMRMLDAHQRAVAATDVRAGLGRHAARLAAQGLGLAIESGRPRRVWRWMERARASALAYRPVHAPRPDEVSELLPRLRSLTAAAMRPDSADEVRRELRRLESRIADLTRAVGGGAERASSSAIPERVLERLGDSCFVELALVEDRMWGVVAFADRARLVDLGPAAEWVSRTMQLSSATWQALVQPGRSAARFEHRLESAREMVLPLVPAPARRLVLAPPPELSAVPWPAVSPIPTVVVPSAATWLRASSVPSPMSRVIAVSGPDLALARPEADAVSAIHPGADVAHEPTAAEFLEIIPHADVAHLACHGTLRTTQPLFTSLRMHDGEVYLHELERLPGLPSLMVLSSCESGSAGGSGSEMLGMASVLLAAGVRTVVASPWPIPDTPATLDAMTDLHRALAAGADPASAVHSWKGRLPHAAYLVFGA